MITTYSRDRVSVSNIRCAMTTRVAILASSIVSAILLSLVAACDGGEENPFDSYRIEPYATGISKPAAFDFAPDGRLFVAEQISGLVRVVDPDGSLLPDPFLSVNLDVVYAPDSTYTETGLVGLAIDPDFEDNHFVYVYYTKGLLGEVGISACVVERYREDSNRAFDPTEILRIEPCTAGWGHVAGGLRFGPDETLFITVGDLQRDGDGKLYGDGSVQPSTAWAQLLDRRAGKVLRINRDGSIPQDNPFLQTAGADPTVYALGFRNPFGLEFHPETGELYLTDGGTSLGDELNLVRPGENYGWPLVLGKAGDGRFAEPLLDFSLRIVPTGLEFYDGDALPELKGALLMCTFGGALHVITLAPPAYDSVVEDKVVAQGCSIDVRTGPDGRVYLLDYRGGNVFVITSD